MHADHFLRVRSRDTSLQETHGSVLGRRINYEKGEVSFLLGRDVSLTRAAEVKAPHAG